jgi:hypothetical protein
VKQVLTAEDQFGPKILADKALPLKLAAEVVGPPRVIQGAG